MQRQEPQHRQVQQQPTQRPAAMLAESPQGEQIAQLEAIMDSSPQVEKLGSLSAMMNNSPALAAQRKLVDMIHNSPRQIAQQKRIERIHNSPVQIAQRKKLGSLTGVAQREKDDDLTQKKSTSKAPAQLTQQPAAKPNNTGLPDNLKSGIENLSGISMDNVKVHYNSSQPAQLNAHAYAQGTDIHVAPGQEQHLPHEAWHVVQQAQGRVQPTMQMKEGVPVNDNAGLEHEADVMGGRAASVGVMKKKSVEPYPINNPIDTIQQRSVNPVKTVKAHGTAKVWLAEGVTHDTGDLYTMNIGNKDTKVELIQTIAKEAGDIGEKQSTRKTDWAQTTDSYGKEKLDAFRVCFSGTYSNTNTLLSMDYHFGPRSLGYVVQVSEGMHTSNMIDANPNSAGNGVATEYSSIHKQTNDENLLNSTNHPHGNNSLKLSSEKAWDSHTKIAGEGARFIPVRKHAPHLTDNSKFFTRDFNSFRWIQFKELWLTWGATFNKAFNIPSQRIETQLNANNMQKLGAENKLETAAVGAGAANDITAGTDYNLTQDRTATQADNETWKVIKFTYTTVGKGKQKRLLNNNISNTLNNSDLVIKNSYADNIDCRTYSVTVASAVSPEQLNNLLAQYNINGDTIAVAGIQKQKEEVVDNPSSDEESDVDMLPSQPVTKTKALNELENFYAKDTKKQMRKLSVTQPEILDAIKRGGTKFNYDNKTESVSYSSTDQFNEIVLSIITSIEIEKKNPIKNDKKTTAIKKVSDERNRGLTGPQVIKVGSIFLFVLIVLFLIYQSI